MDTAIKILRNPKASKEQLRAALAAALGVDYEPAQKEKQPSEFNEARVLFFETYSKQTGLEYMFGAVDGRALASLIGKVKNLNPDGNVLETLAALFQNLPDWYKCNAFSLPQIDKNFNAITAKINNGKTKGVTDDYKQGIIRDLCL